MDPATIATAAVTLLVPYVKEAAKEFAGEAGKTALQKVGTLFTMLKQRLGGDAAASDTLTRFEQSPERYQPFLEDVLKERLEKDEAFRTEAARMLAEIKASAPELAIVQKLDEGEGITGVEAGELASGRVTVDQTIGKGKDVTGARIDRIGS